MSHTYDHSSGRHHHRAVDPVNMNTVFVVGIILNFAFVIIEVVTGLYNHSFSLLSDARHIMRKSRMLILVLLN